MPSRPYPSLPTRSRAVPRAVRMRTGASALAAAAVLAGVLVAPAGAGAAPGHGRSALDVHATASHGVVAPTHERPGLVQLSTHHGVIFLLQAKHAGATRADVARRFDTASPRPLLARYRVIAVAGSPTDNVVRLQRGSYFFVDAVARVHAAQVARMRVSGRRVDMARIPSARTAVVTRRDHLEIPGKLHRNCWLHVENHSDRFVYVFMLRVPPRLRLGVTRAAVARPMVRSRAAQRVIRLALLGAMSGHRTVYDRNRTYPGTYLAVAVHAGSGDGLSDVNSRIVHVH